MQQVDKKNFRIILIISFISIFFIIGCSSKNNDYVKSVRYFDNNISKDHLLYAAKKVFRFADKEDFIIDAYRSDLNVTKSKAYYKFYTMDIQNDHFDFHVDQNNTANILKGSVSIYRTYGVDDDKPFYLDRKDNAYKLFWDRVLYFLGKKDDWSSCSVYELDGYLCDLIELENKVPTKKDIINLDSNNTNVIKKTITGQTQNIIPKKNINMKLDKGENLGKQSNKDSIDNNATFDSYKSDEDSYVNKK